MADSKEKTWKDHPVIIAAGSFGAALVFAQTVIFPTTTASLQNENSSLRSQVQEIASLKDNLKKTQESANAEKQKMDEELKRIKGQLLVAQQTNLFSLGNPYPVGFGKIKLGDSIAAITANYSEARIDRRSAQDWAVKPDHPAFRNVIYIFDRPNDLKDRRVRAILFFADDSIAASLQDKMIEALGQPTAPGPRPNCFIWNVDKALFVRKDDDTRFALISTQPDCKIPEK